MRTLNILVAVSLSLLIVSCKSSSEPDAVAPGMRATIDGAKWSSDSAYAIARDTSNNCMTIYGIASGKTVMLTCLKTVKAGDSVATCATYYQSSGGLNQFKADSGSIQILKRSSDNIQGRFWFRAHMMPLKRYPPAPDVMITEGEFNVRLNTNPY